MEIGRYGACEQDKREKRGLIRVAVDEAREDGHGDDAEIEEQAPVLEVVEVVLDALVDGGVAAPTVDLGPAGDADAQAVTVVVAADFLKEALDEMRAFGARADQANPRLLRER